MAHVHFLLGSFEYPIGRCDDAIEDVGDGTQYVWFISVDSAQGYHQIRVRACDKDKLAFFAPDDEKYTWEVMPFGPTNAPTFFTAKTRVMQREAMTLFRMYCTQIDVQLFSSRSKQPPPIVAALPRTNDYELSCSGMFLPDLIVDKEFTLNPPGSPIMQDTAVIPLEATTNVVRQQMQGSTKEHVSGSKVIIDDCLLYSTSLGLALLLL